MNYSVKKFKIELQKIVDSLEWFHFDKCPNCGAPLKASILDGNEGVVCSKCKEGIMWGDFFPEECEKYQYLFLDAMRESLERVVDVTYDFCSCYLRAYTSLEVFLSKVVEYQFKKRRADDKAIQSRLMRTNLNSYKKLLKEVNIEIEEKAWSTLWKVAEVRNKIVHKGFLPSEEQILKAFKRISRIFIILSGYSI